jgi:hypothetical protein
MDMSGYLGGANSQMVASKDTLIVHGLPLQYKVGGVFRPPTPQNAALTWFCTLPIMQACD